MMSEGTLCPVQEEIYRLLNSSLQAGEIVVVYGDTGRGKTTVMQHAHGQLGGVFLTMADYVAALRAQNPQAMEETFETVIREAIDAAQSIVFMEDLHLFYERVHRIFEAAKDNAPSSIFIDDSDVIFQNNEEMGLYRYLLTMLDGLESESAGRVCVMMTAIDVSNLPPALIRSGRVELWLETRLPDQMARGSILKERAACLPAALQGVDLALLAEATEDLTGAGIKRVMEDDKLLYAYDRAQNAPIKPLTDYFLAAIETVRTNKERYAQAEERTHRQNSSRPAWFDVMSNMAVASTSYRGDDEDF